MEKNYLKSFHKPLICRLRHDLSLKALSCLLIFNALSHLFLLVIMAVALVPYQDVSDNVFLVKNYSVSEIWRNV